MDLSLPIGSARDRVGGIVSLTCGEQTSPRPGARSPCRDRVAPLVGRLGSEDPERRARDEMALKVEGVMDGGVHAKKPLGRSSRLEPLHFVLSSSHQLVRIFGAIVLPQSLLMRAGQSQTLERSRDRASPFGWHADAGCGARAGRGPVARSTRERARSIDEHEAPPIEPGFPGSFLVLIAMVGLRKQLLRFWDMAL